MDQQIGSLIGETVSNVCINSYLTLGLTHFVEPFIKSIERLATVSNRYTYVIDLHCFVFSKSEAEQAGNAFNAILARPVVQNLSIRVDIQLCDFNACCRAFGQAPSTMMSWRDEVENDVTTSNNYPWKLLCSAFLRYRRVVDSYNHYCFEIQRQEGQISATFVHADIDTIFLQPIWESIPGEEAQALWLREESLNTSNSVYGGLIVVKGFFGLHSVFHQHKLLLDSTKPSSWLRGHGQATLVKAVKNLIAAGFRINNLADSSPLGHSSITKSLNPRSSVVIGNSHGGRRRKHNTSSDFLYLLNRLDESVSNFSRSNPSEMYHDLHSQYALMHSTAKDDKVVFPGKKCCEMAPLIQRFALMHNCTSLLDYGGGKGVQYTPSVKFVDKTTGHEYLGLNSLVGIEASNTFVYDPAGANCDINNVAADLVICNDVLEHIYQEDLHWILSEIFRSSKECVFLTIACYLDRKTLPGGIPCHITVKPPTWWFGLIRGIASGYSNIKYLANCWTIADQGFQLHLDSNMRKSQLQGYDPDPFITNVSQLGKLNDLDIFFRDEPLRVARHIPTADAGQFQ